MLAALRTARTVLTCRCFEEVLNTKCARLLTRLMQHTQQASDSLSSATVAALTTATTAALASEQQRLLAMTAELDSVRQKSQRYQAALAAAANRRVKAFNIVHSIFY